jgi:16S rRNA (uracil1498-N3)-methyltransferase
LHRFYVPLVAPEGEFPLSREQTRKITRVLKLAPGARIALWDNAGKEYEALITNVTGQIVYVRVTGERQAAPEPPLRVTLVQGIAKGEKMDLIIQKATEIGVARICPVTTERTVVQIPPERRPGRLERWQSIAAEAARQSGRVNIPEIAPITDLSGLFGQAEREALRLILWEEESAGLKTLLRSEPPGAAGVCLLIGPEGGLSRQEVEAGRAQGWRSVSLGPRLLRTETAGLIAAALLLYEWGDLGGQ